MAKWDILPNEAYLFYSKAIEFIVNFAEYFRGSIAKKKCIGEFFLMARGKCLKLRSKWFTLDSEAIHRWKIDSKTNIEAISVIRIQSAVTFFE